ncbi:Mpv17/PMP22 family protein [Myxococcota bacterium]|nr:Mpv17/PMP22 family protein [Myxococcota bacterium]MBU1899423.1 Mpv17/PMP22 family protein [Myxococcota bacterium]
MIMAAAKFALLATLGELIGQRVRTGRYHAPGFGVLPRAVIWGLLGLTIKFAFIVFAVGTPAFLREMGLTRAGLDGDLSVVKVLTAFSISCAMNVIYAPVMMTAHKITDAHILAYGGRLSCLLKPIQVRAIIAKLDWETQWSFVFKKTIPYFWIPAHTITFLLPPEHRVLMAAALGIALGVILSVASLRA